MNDLLTKLRRNEPLRLILWPVLIALFGALVTRGIIDTSVADLLTAAALAILGYGGTELARSNVWPAGHLPVVPASVAIDQVRGQIGEQLGQDGLDALTQIEEMIQAAAAASAPRGRHAE